MITIRKVLTKRISPMIVLTGVVLVFVIIHLWFNSHKTFNSTEVVNTNFYIVDELTSMFYDEDNIIGNITDGNPQKGNITNINLFF